MNRHIRPKLLLLAFAIGTTSGISCRSRNDDHCYFNEGNATCLERYPDGSRPYCATNCISTPGGDGCTDVRPEDDACYSPCGMEMTFLECDDAADSGSEGEESGTEGPRSGGRGGSETMGPGPGESESGTNGGCEGDEDCGGLTPFCGDGGECVSCAEMLEPGEACAGADAGLPVCDAGVCVACTGEDLGACGGVTPVCEEESKSCVGCRYHEECPESACNALTGACLDAEQVGVGPGEEYATVAAALGSVGEGDEAVFVVHETGMVPDYGGSLTLSGGRAVALLAAEGERPRVQGSGAPTFLVDGATLLVDGLMVEGNNLGIRVTGGGGLVLDRTEVVDNNAGGIEVLMGSEALLRNTIVGGDRNNVYALDVRGSTVEVVYTTMVAGFGTASALFCDGQASVEVRNSIMLSQTESTPEIQCMNATISNSATHAEAGNLNEAWFSNWNGGNFRLSATGGEVFADIARWETGDPATDIGNTAGTSYSPRPNTDGASDYAGAHIP